MYSYIVKRIIDLVLAILLLVLVSPLFALLMIILALSNRGSPFFLQKRPGRNAELFVLIKFKSMNDKRDENGILYPNEKRLTKIGKYVRRSSLDEIPQIINVLIGDMSFIGPRPLKIDYLELYSESQKRRHDVRPGITGWAQVNGRNAISYSKRFEYDIWYVDNISFLLDFKIFLKTVLEVFNKETIDKTGVNPNIPFNGHN